MSRNVVTIDAMRRLTYEESLALRVSAGYQPHTGWRRRGACAGITAGHEHPHLVCAVCPVRMDCLATIMRDEQHLDSGAIVSYVAVRAEIRRKHRLPRPRRAECGTPAGYKAHRDADEDACDSCKEANAIAKRHNRKSRAKGVAA